MAARGSIDLSFRADLSNLTQQLAKMPDVTKKEASAMIKELEKQFKLAEKAADKLAKKTAKSFRGANGAAAGAGKAVASARPQVRQTQRSRALELLLAW